MQKRHSDDNGDLAVTRDDLVALLNEDLAGEYQAIISYVVYSQVIQGAKYMNIAAELEKHATEELAHALTIAGQIDYLGGMPLTVAKPIKTSDKAEDMLRFDLETRMRQSVVIGYACVSAKRWASTLWPNTSATSSYRNKTIRWLWQTPGRRSAQCHQT